MLQQHPPTDTTQIYTQCRDEMVMELQRQYRAGSFSTISFSSDMVLSALKSLVSPLLAGLPDYETVKANSRFIKRLGQIDMIKLLHARENFDKGLMKSLTSKASVKAALKQFTDSLDAHREEMIYLAVIAPVAGSSAFIVGTVCQIVCDFFNTIISLLTLAWKGLCYAGNYAYTAIAGTEEAPGISVSVLRDILPANIDLETLFMEDIPSFIDGVMAFGVSILEDYSDNAEKWGKDLGDYILATAGNSFNTGYSLFFVPMNPDDYPFDKAWCAVKQWYYLGTMLGPMIVDIVLLFCSGSVSGYFSAANKLGKVGKIGEVFEAFKYFSELKKLSVIRNIASKWEESEVLRVLVQKIFGTLIEPALGVGEKLKTVISDAYKILNKTDELPELEEVLEKMDELYDKAQNVDFFMSTALLLLGCGFDKDGQITTAE